MRRLLRPLIAALAAVAGLFAIMATTGAFGGSDGGVASAASSAQQIGMRVLVITDSTDTADEGPNQGTAIAYADWVNTLKREGVPYDSVVTNPNSSGSVSLPALSSTAADGTQIANYEGVVVAGSGLQGLSTAQWTTLQTFEQHFSVRQVTAYAVPSSDYGLSAPSPANGEALSGATTALTLTPAGHQVFPYLNTVGLDKTFGTYAYEGTVLSGANVQTLVSGPGSSALLGIYTSSDGRETMFQTFDQNQNYLQSELLRHGELDWLARNTYFGDQRNYLETQVDDNFLSDDSWSVAGDPTTGVVAHSTDFNPTDALREVPADVQKAATWSRQNNFRIDMLFNGGGSVQAANGGTDPLLGQFQATDPATSKPYTNDFGWINHTWDHPNLDEGCATTNYIAAEINQNSAWGSNAAKSGNPTSGGLGLTSSTDSTATAFGTENPQAVVTGEHSGLANLIPGNPGQVDPPELNDDIAAAPTGGTLATGQYVYAISDQFNTALPSAPPVPGSGESAASVSAPVSVTGPTGAVSLDWDAVCHAADYKIYRAPYTGTYPTGTVGTWALIDTVPANLSTDFHDPASTTDTTNGGAQPIPYVDTGKVGSAATPPTTGTAVESPYDQNPNLDAAFPLVDGGLGLKYFGSDASKPYPSPADSQASSPSTTGLGSSFSDAGATAIPRYPTNIYYNVSTNAQEVDEYNWLYLPSSLGGNCTTGCLSTASSITDIVNSVDQNMFWHMMGNDPRPHYFHQTNLMDQGTGPANAQGTGLFYETVDPLLSSYNTYFASNAPLEQLTMAQIGTLLSEQSIWAAATRVSGSIEGDVVTVENNSGFPLSIPLTGTNVGTSYAGTQSGWTSAAVGSSTYTASSTWPALPTTPVIVTPPTGGAPGAGSGTTAPGPTPPKQPSTGGAPPKPAAAITYFAVQAAPKTVKVSHGKVTVSLNCQASKGRTAKGKTCAGTFALTVAGHKVSHSFRFKSGKVDRITVKLPKRSMSAVTAAAHHKPKARNTAGKLVITTKLTGKQVKKTTGKLTIKG